ncbi:amino acid ABC transporter permease [Levilactobacillus tangyuanensis]|uniref:Amino acid ABC transporter permease n=1 Tax=Levilactobacillus tangyuanensis TaxID=2486021 RepID=A0ABW1TKH4_9LACO|nr:amino acid ABC transporter permease [Levilactobacillus tangyuanensis]
MLHDFIAAYTPANLRYLFGGLGLTLLVSVVSILASFVLGSFMGIVRYVRIKGLSAIVGGIIDVIRNLPLILILFFTYFGLPNLGIRPGVLVAVILAMTIFESAMLAEIVRSGIQAIDKGQMEGARANGLSYWQALWHIVLPQAMVKMIPALVSQFISLVKDTSLATIILLPEMLYRSQIIYGQDSNYIVPMFVAVAALYFAVCFLLSILAHWLERRQART